MSKSAVTPVPVPAKSNSPVPPIEVLRTMRLASLVFSKVQVTFSPASMVTWKCVSPTLKPLPPPLTKVRPS